MGLNYFCTLMCLYYRILWFLDTVDRTITWLYWSLTSKHQQTFLPLEPSQGIVSCTIPRYIIRRQKRRKTEWSEVAVVRGSVSSHYAESILDLLCSAADEISPRLPIALPILYTISKAINVGTKPIAKKTATSPRFILNSYLGGTLIVLQTYCQK